MKKYKGLKKIEEINQKMSMLGMSIEMDEFEKGGDWIHYKGIFYGMWLHIALNVFNGWFFVYDKTSPDAIATHRSNNLDEVEWYKNLLDLIYVS